MKIFAERLKELRTEKDISQRELAKLTGISHTTVMRWENGSCEPPAEAIVTIAKFFGVSSDYLLGLAD